MVQWLCGEYEPISILISISPELICLRGGAVFLGEFLPGLAEYVVVQELVYLLAAFGTSPKIECYARGNKVFRFGSAASRAYSQAVGEPIPGRFSHKQSVKRTDLLWVWEHRLPVPSLPIPLGQILFNVV